MMSDIVVTVPKVLWREWLAEGDLAGEPRDPATGEEWAFYTGGGRPSVDPGERCYIVAHNLLRGYAPVTRVVQTERGWAICRKGGAVAVTIPELIRGFRGWRERWWPRGIEVAFQDWRTTGVSP